MSQSLTPVALFAYNRPDHVNRALAALSRCCRLDECALHVFCDGPCDDEDEAAVRNTRRVIGEWARRLSARIVERPANVGLARSIVDGVTELCEEHGRAIVIEDDLEVSPGFVDFMLHGLGRYRDPGEVYQISGYMFPVQHPDGDDAFFLPLTTTWGWATWQRAWSAFDWDARDALRKLEDPAVRCRFDLNDSYAYSTMLEDRLAGRNESWGILWWWSVFQRDGLVLHPLRSLVHNSGFDGSGTHCGLSDQDEEIRRAVLEFDFGRPIALPPRVVEDEAAFGRITQFLRERQQATQPAVATASME